jgi:hypothetical protein
MAQLTEVSGEVAKDDDGTAKEPTLSTALGASSLIVFRAGPLTARFFAASAMGMYGKASGGISLSWVEYVLESVCVCMFAEGSGFVIA